MKVKNEAPAAINHPSKYGNDRTVRSQGLIHDMADIAEIHTK